MSLRPRLPLAHSSSMCSGARKSPGLGVGGWEIMVRRVAFVEPILRARHCAECFIFKKDPGVGTVIVSISQMRKPRLAGAAPLAKGSFCNILEGTLEMRDAWS